MSVSPLNRQYLSIADFELARQPDFDSVIDLRVPGGHVAGVHVHLVPYPHVALSVPTPTYQTVWYVPASGSALESWAKARKLPVFWTAGQSP